MAELWAARDWAAAAAATAATALAEGCSELSAAGLTTRCKDTTCPGSVRCCTVWHHTWSPQDSITPPSGSFTVIFSVAGKHGIQHCSWYPALLPLSDSRLCGIFPLIHTPEDPHTAGRELKPEWTTWHAAYQVQKADELPFC